LLGHLCCVAVVTIDFKQTLFSSFQLFVQLITPHFELQGFNCWDTLCLTTSKMGKNVIEWKRKKEKKKIHSKSLTVNLIFIGIRSHKFITWLRSIFLHVEPKMCRIPQTLCKVEKLFLFLDAFYLWHLFFQASKTTTSRLHVVTSTAPEIHPTYTLQLVLPRRPFPQWRILMRSF